MLATVGGELWIDYDDNCYITSFSIPFDEASTYNALNPAARMQD